MTDASPSNDRQGLVLGGLMLFQSACAVFFVGDVLRDAAVLGRAAWTDIHILIEAFAALGLILGIGVELRALVALLARQARAERGLSIAAGALHDLMERYFEDWGLTAAERDVAAFALKGCAIAEIAELRGTATGTVKAHLNAIYRKAGVSGQGQLQALIVEDLMAQPLVAPGDRPPDPPRRGWRFLRNSL